MFPMDEHIQQLIQKVRKIRDESYECSCKVDPNEVLCASNNDKHPQKLRKRELERKLSTYKRKEIKKRKNENGNWWIIVPSGEGYFGNLYPQSFSSGMKSEEKGSLNEEMREQNAFQCLPIQVARCLFALYFNPI